MLIIPLVEEVSSAPEMEIGSFVEKAVAGRWIAGAEVSDAIEVAKSFNKHRIRGIINFLGEDLDDKRQVDATVTTYLSLIDEIGRRGIKADISIKITQLGYDIDEKIAKSNYERVVRAARKKDVFVWLDMEEHRYVDPAIRLYKSQLRRGGVGICIQSYLKRSGDDVRKLVNMNGVIRLVKGAYKEGPRLAFASRAQATQNYLLLMNYLFRHSEKFMVATHDIRIIDEALLLNRSYRRDVTFAMLNGIRNGYAVQLATTNKVAVYIPFGRRWFAYSLRRLKEEGHLNLIVRSFFENQSV
jgi:proline dehydrogenase